MCGAMRRPPDAQFNVRGPFLSPSPGVRVTHTYTLHAFEVLFYTISDKVQETQKDSGLNERVECGIGTAFAGNRIWRKRWTKKNRIKENEWVKAKCGLTQSRMRKTWHCINRQCEGNNRIGGCGKCAMRSINPSLLRYTKTYNNKMYVCYMMACNVTRAETKQRTTTTKKICLNGIRYSPNHNNVINPKNIIPHAGWRKAAAGA